MPFLPPNQQSQNTWWPVDQKDEIWTTANKQNTINLASFGEHIYLTQSSFDT